MEAESWAYAYFSALHDIPIEGFVNQKGAARNNPVHPLQTRNP